MPRSKTPRRLSGRPPKHAGRLLARALREGKLDGRSQIARIRRDLEADLIADLGGDAHVSTAQRLLIERAVSTALICSAFEAFVFRAESPVGADGEPLSVLRSYVSHSQSLSRLLQVLGLRRETIDRVPDLSTYLRDRAATAQNTPEERHTADLSASTRPTAADTYAAAADAPEAAPARPGADDDEG